MRVGKHEVASRYFTAKESLENCFNFKDGLNKIVNDLDESIAYLTGTTNEKIFPELFEYHLSADGKSLSDGQLLDSRGKFVRVRDDIKSYLEGGHLMEENRKYIIYFLDRVYEELEKR